MFILDLKPSTEFSSRFVMPVVEYLKANGLGRVCFGKQLEDIAQATGLPVFVVETTLKAIGHWHLWNDAGDTFDGREAEEKFIELAKAPLDPSLKTWYFGVRVASLASLTQKEKSL